MPLQQFVQDDPQVADPCQCCAGTGADPRTDRADFAELIPIGTELVRILEHCTVTVR